MPPGEDEGYVCTLSEEIQRQALEELNEDPATRDQCIREIREWVKQRPHLHARTGMLINGTLILSLISHLRNLFQCF